MAMLGIALAAASAAAINHLIDQKIDGVSLTRIGLCPKHYLKSSEVIAFADSIGH